MKSITTGKQTDISNNLIANQPNISNLQNCIEDVKKAALTNAEGPIDPTNYHELRGRLESSRDKLPPLYRESIFNPFVKLLDDLGQSRFTEILLSDPGRTRTAALMLDIAQAILQNGEDYNIKATDAFQEVVSDLYDGFLSSEDRSGVKPPDKSTIPALVKWGNPEAGPYTWPIDATSIFGLKAAIVSLPPINATRGLLAWASIPHEVCGHNILHADIGLIEELSNTVRNSLIQQNIPQNLSEYWASRIDETASDIMGVLNLGPSAAIGLIGYFRGLNAASLGKPILRNEGVESDPHAVDILRGYLGAYAVSLLNFKQAQEWAKVIEEETDKDLTNIQIGAITVNETDAKKSAKIVAHSIMKTKLASLENHSLDEMQNWRNEDEEIVTLLRPLLNSMGSLPDAYKSGFYAAHVVAAAVTEAISKDHDINLIFDRMVSLLKDMHDTNPSWGPLYVKHPGNIVRHLIYPL